jgi:hypothetical protein
MPASKRRYPILPILIIALASVIEGCAKDRSPTAPLGTNDPAGLTDGLRSAAASAPQFPPRGGPTAMLRNIWPNEDGRSWTYRIEERSWDLPELRLYPTAAEVPPAPGLDDVVVLLDNHPIGNNPQNSAAGYRMTFNGMKTTLSGAVGQNLETSVFDLGAGSAEVASSTVPSDFIMALSKARPDLRERIARRWPSTLRAPTAPSTQAQVQRPLFLFGYAWEKTREYIGSYGDLNRDLSWKYLLADLRPGTEFSMQLVPDLANDVFLHVRVLRMHDAPTELGTFPKAIEVLYLVDFGTSEVTDVDGNSLGAARWYAYGTITYAPRVGPVTSYERGLVQTGQPIDPGNYDLTIGLTGVTPGRSRGDQ